MKKKTAQEFFSEREKEERKKLLENKEYKEASDIKKTEFSLALRLRNTLRLD